MLKRTTETERERERRKREGSQRREAYEPEEWSDVNRKTNREENGEEHSQTIVFACRILVFLLRQMLTRATNYATLLFASCLRCSPLLLLLRVFRSNPDDTMEIVGYLIRVVCSTKANRYAAASCSMFPDMRTLRFARLGLRRVFVSRRTTWSGCTHAFDPARPMRDLHERTRAREGSRRNGDTRGGCSEIQRGGAAALY